MELGIVCVENRRRGNLARDIGRNVSAGRKRIGASAERVGVSAIGAAAERVGVLARRRVRRCASGNGGTEQWRR